MIIIENVDRVLLKEQLEYLYSLPMNDNKEGIINLLEYILDKSEIFMF